MRSKMKIAVCLFLLLSVFCFVQIEAASKKPIDKSIHSNQLDRPNGVKISNPKLENKKHIPTPQKANKHVSGDKHKRDKSNYAMKSLKSLKHKKKPNINQNKKINSAPIVNRVHYKDKKIQHKINSFTGQEMMVKIICNLYSFISSIFPIDFLRQFCATKTTVATSKTTVSNGIGTTGGPVGGSSKTSVSTRSVPVSGSSSTSVSSSSTTASGGSSTSGSMSTSKTTALQTTAASVPSSSSNPGLQTTPAPGSISSSTPGIQTTGTPIPGLQSTTSPVPATSSNPGLSSISTTSGLTSTSSTTGSSSTSQTSGFTSTFSTTGSSSTSQIADITSTSTTDSQTSSSSTSVSTSTTDNNFTDSTLSTSPTTDAGPPNPYCSISTCTTQSSNTLCRFSNTSTGSACSPLDQTKSVVSQSEITTILDVSNTLRLKVANGNESAGNPGPQPSASNMRKLVWDSELAKMAQTWAQQCTLSHDTCRDVSRFNVGQNIYISFNTGPFSAPDWTAAINDWYSEVSNMNALSYVDNFPSSPSGTIGHYTQLVWGNTYTVGCGIAFFQSTSTQPSFPYKAYYVCNYGPAGNWLNEAVYTKGTVGTACPVGTSNNGGLCA